MPDNAKFKSDFIEIGLRYTKSFGVFLGLGVFSIFLFRCSWMPSGIENWRRFFGAVLGASVVFARLGWDGQSWGGNSLPEKVDKYFFWAFSVVSFFLFV